MENEKKTLKKRDSKIQATFNLKKILRHTKTQKAVLSEAKNYLLLLK